MGTKRVGWAVGERCAKQHQVVPQNFEPRSHFLLAYIRKRIVDFCPYLFFVVAGMSCFAFIFFNKPLYFRHLVFAPFYFYPEP